MGLIQLITIENIVVLMKYGKEMNNIFKFLLKFFSKKKTEKEPLVKRCPGCKTHSGQ